MTCHCWLMEYKPNLNKESLIINYPITNLFLLNWQNAFAGEDTLYRYHLFHLQLKIAFDFPMPTTDTSMSNDFDFSILIVPPNLMFSRRGVRTSNSGRYVVLSPRRSTLIWPRMECSVVPSTINLPEICFKLSKFCNDPAIEKVKCEINHLITVAYGGEARVL